MHIEGTAGREGAGGRERKEEEEEGIGRERRGGRKEGRADIYHL